MVFFQVLKIVVRMKKDVDGILLVLKMKKRLIIEKSIGKIVFIIKIKSSLRPFLSSLPFF